MSNGGAAELAGRRRRRRRLVYTYNMHARRHQAREVPAGAAAKVMVVLVVSVVLGVVWPAIGLAGAGRTVPSKATGKGGGGGGSTKGCTGYLRSRGLIYRSDAAGAGNAWDASGDRACAPHPTQGC